MRVEDLLVYGKSHCHSTHAKLLLAELLEKNPLELLLYLEDEVPIEKVNLYKQEVEALEKGKPLQYVLGTVNFCGKKFMIDERCLIPRFETEELVEETIKYAKKYFENPVDIIDLGCGSGVIGLTLEKRLSTNSVDLVDISKDALEVTKKNKDYLFSKANLIQSNFFTNINKTYDIIISNPPYIGNNEEIEQIVKDNEPHIALYAGEDGLDSYKKILENISTYMKDRCLIAFEIGCLQKEDIINLVNKYLKDVKIETKKDLSKRDRMIFILKNLE